MAQPFVLRNSSQTDIRKNAEADKLQSELIKKWAPKVRTALQSSALRFKSGKVKSFVLRHNGTQKETKLADSIRSQTRDSFGVTNSVSFKFERHGVFVYKGVGKGINRVSQDWFNKIMDENIPELADRIAEIRADAVLEETNLKIR